MVSVRKQDWQLVATKYVACSPSVQGIFVSPRCEPGTGDKWTYGHPGIHETGGIICGYYPREATPPNQLLDGGPRAPCVRVLADPKYLPQDLPEVGLPEMPAHQFHNRIRVSYCHCLAGSRHLITQLITRGIDQLDDHALPERIQGHRCPRSKECHSPVGTQMKS